MGSHVAGWCECAMELGNVSKRVCTSGCWHARVTGVVNKLLKKKNGVVLADKARFAD